MIIPQKRFLKKVEANGCFDHTEYNQTRKILKGNDYLYKLDWCYGIEPENIARNNLGRSIKHTIIEYFRNEKEKNLTTYKVDRVPS